MTTLSKVILSFSGLLIVAAGFLAIAKKQMSEPFQNVNSTSINIQQAPRHPVTSEMDERTKKLRANQAPDFTLPTQDGQTITLNQVLKEKPVFLIMTKDGCPCSIEAQRPFNDLANAYSDKIQFLGLIDCDKDQAEKYALDFGVKYPIAYTLSKDTFRAYKSKQSVFTYLIAQDGQFIKAWPGYNQDMLNELNTELAKLANTNPAPLDMTMVPTELSSGCYFFTEPLATEPSW